VYQVYLRIKCIFMAILRAVGLLALNVCLGAMAQTLHCVQLEPSPFCLNGNARSIMPKKVCSAKEEPVKLAKPLSAGQFVKAQNATCQKNPSLVTKEMYCQTNMIPCADGLACPSTTKLCYSLCLSGGQAGVHTFLPPSQCINGVNPGQESAYCNARVSAGEVASVADTAAGKCVGLSYFNTYYMMSVLAQTPFQPRACRGRFPIFNKQMVNFNTDMRVTFMKSLAKKINRLWGYTNNPDGQKFKRPINIRLRRVQLQKGVVQVYTEIKEFCMMEMRTGSYDYSLKYNNDKYCDDVSVSPDAVYQNLTDLLNTKRVDRGMDIGEFKIMNASKPGWPTKCYTWQPEEKPKIPNWVWAVTAIGAMCCLLSTLILQHRYRNRASYVRLNEKLRSYV